MSIVWSRFEKIYFVVHHKDDTGRELDVRLLVVPKRDSVEVTTVVQSR